jgi:hypothetical protein
MNANEWRQCKDFTKLVENLPNLLSQRKQRLFLCGCTRTAQAKNEADDIRIAAALEAAEMYADRLITATALAAHHRVVTELSQFSHNVVVRGSFHAGIFAMSIWKISHSAVCATYPPNNGPLLRTALSDLGHPRLDQGVLLDLFRCVMGNPFRVPAPDTRACEWRTHTIECLTQAIYEERAFDRLPVLADALEEAGCTDAEILSHCRQPGEHVRGCWVVDLILGKQ